MRVAILKSVLLRLKYDEWRNVLLGFFFGALFIVCAQNYGLELLRLVLSSKDLSLESKPGNFYRVPNLHY